MSAPAGDVVLVRANVRTLDGARPRVTTLAVRAGRVAYAGDDERAARAAAQEAPVLDLAGRTVTPGLVDSHTHLAHWAKTRGRLSLAGVDTLERALARVAEAHAALPPGVPLLGEDVPPFGSFGPLAGARDLERAAPGRVVVLRGRDRHAAWVSAAALAGAGVTRATPDPPGGRIGLDAQGEPDGLVYESALERFGGLAAGGEADALAGTLAELGALGLTGVHEFGDDPAYEEFARLDREQGLPLRMAFGFLHGGPGGPAAPGARRAGARLRPFALKGYVDGTLGSRTAWMLEPYEDGGGTGVPTLEPGALDALCTEALAARLQVALHAIGDRATRAALDAFERIAPLERARLRPRIEHAQLVHPDDVPRFARLGVIASMQPSHAVSDRAQAGRAWGGRDARGGYAWRQLEDAGTVLAFGSDVPIEPPDPRIGLWAAVTGADPAAAARGERPARALSLEHAFRAYTTGAARAAGNEAELGRLAPGFLADFVVWGEDPWTLPAERLRAVPVEQTWVDGARIWPVV